MLSGIFRFAARIGVLNKPNPIREVCLPQAPQRGDAYAYTLNEITRMLAALPEPAKTVVALAAFTGLRRGEIRGLKLDDYDGSVLHVRRSVWNKHVGEPKGKRGRGAVPVIAPLSELLNSHIVRCSPKEYLFPTVKGGPADLDYLSREIIAPKLSENGLQWHGWHAFRRGLATNLHELGISDIVIQAILRHSTVEVTRESYIKRDGVDTRSLAAMKALEKMVCNHCATGATP
jgi:integrase